MYCMYLALKRCQSTDTLKLGENIDAGGVKEPPAGHDVAVFPWHFWWLFPNGPVSINKSNVDIPFSFKVNKILFNPHGSYEHKGNNFKWCRHHCKMMYVFMHEGFFPPFLFSYVLSSVECMKHWRRVKSDWYCFLNFTNGKITL